MKIIIADAKILKYKQLPIVGKTPLFLDKTKVLVEQLSKLSSSELKETLNVSFKQADLIYDYYQHINETYPALSLYQGVVYQQLKLDTYKEVDFDFINQYVLIMSPLYGVLHCNDLISYHRLEMKDKITNLYQFWQKEVNDYLNDEDFLLSLTTKEYLRLIKHPNIINIDFGDQYDDKIVRKAIYLKQARGKMLDIIVKNKFTSIEDIKTITFDGYRYVEDLSTNNNLVFLRTPTKKYVRL